MTSTWTLEIGPNLLSIGRYVLYGTVLVYLIVQWWSVAGMKGRH